MRAYTLPGFKTVINLDAVCYFRVCNGKNWDDSLKGPRQVTVKKKHWIGPLRYEMVECKVDINEVDDWAIVIQPCLRVNFQGTYKDFGTETFEEAQELSDLLKKEMNK